MRGLDGTRQPIWSCIIEQSRTAISHPLLNQPPPVAAILSAAIPLLVALASLLWWVYKRGEVAGEEKANYGGTTVRRGPGQRRQRTNTAQGP